MSQPTSTSLCPESKESIALVASRDSECIRMEAFTGLVASSCGHCCMVCRGLANPSLSTYSFTQAELRDSLRHRLVCFPYQREWTYKLCSSHEVELAAVFLQRDAR